MSDQFEWKAEIKFKGTAEEFNKWAYSVESLRQAGNIQVTIPEWRKIELERFHTVGCMPFLIDTFVDQQMLHSVIEGQTRMKIQHLTDIYGGIRTPHLHLGEEVVLLDRDRFKVVVAEIAHKLASKRVDAIEDYIGVMANVGNLVEGV